ncbi:MAG: hypothetical protein KME27_10565 [Lyngbya sp. HA4199-MV5]|jgi:hypothetical protein|nr:hypothetical protein [Lyngbya sp. HA4199-MV5]
MTVNASACWLKILIGSDQQDWSQTLKSFDVSLPKRDRSGLLPITGTLTLTYWDYAPESMNPRLNAQRWHRGQSVKVLASLDGVTYTPHPCGWLYILKEALPPHPDTPDLVLQVGCLLALRDFAEPDNDKSGIVLGVATSRTDAIAPILAAAGITTWVGAVPAYPIAHPLPKIGGSYVQQAGKVAYAGQKALWQDNQGQIQALDLRLDPTATPVVDITIGPGGGEIIYQPSEGAETPVEELRCVGIDKIGIDTWRCLTSNPDEEYQSSVSGGTVSTTVLRRTTITDCQDGGSKYRQEVIEETAGVVYPVEEPGSLRLTFSSDSTTTYFYEPGPTGRLLKILRVTLRPVAAAAAAWWANLTEEQRLSYDRFQPATASEETTTFTYQDYPNPQDGSVADQYAFNYQTQVVAGQAIATKLPVAAIAPNEDLTVLADPLALNLAALVVEKSAKVRGYEWQKTTVTRSSFITANAEAAANFNSLLSKLALVTTDARTEVSAVGGQQPSAPERRPERYTEIEIQVKGRALFGTPAGSNEQKRFRTIEVEYMVSSEQADAIAQMEGALLIGRRQGQTILVPFDERFLNGFSPLSNWRCTEPDITTYLYQADAISFTHDPDRAVVSCEGIWQATVAVGTTAVKLPYSPIVAFDGGICFGGNIRVYPYDLGTVSDVFRGGVRLGGRLSPIVTTTFRGGVKAGGRFVAGPRINLMGGIKVGGIAAFAGITRSYLGGVRLGGNIESRTVPLIGGFKLGGSLDGAAVTGIIVYLEITDEITFALDSLTVSTIQIESITFQVG